MGRDGGRTARGKDCREVVGGDPRSFDSSLRPDLTYAQDYGSESKSGVWVG